MSTAVVQGRDLITHRTNGFVYELDDIDGLVEGVKTVSMMPDSDLKQIKLAGRITADNHSYASLSPVWANFMDGFVSRG